MEFRKGSRRYVFVFKNKVVKIPSLSSWKAFVLGVLENLEERTWIVADYTKFEWHNRNPLARIYFADRFGLFVVMEKATVYSEAYLKEHYPGQFKLLERWSKGYRFGDDFKADNLGIVDDCLVFIDYGYCDCSMWVGNPVRVVSRNGQRKTTLRWKIESFARKLFKGR